MEMTLKQQIKQTLNLPDDHFHNYCSDLLVLHSERVYNWLKEHYKFFVNVKVVTGNVKGSDWYGKKFIDIPFAYTLEEYHIKHYNKSLKDTYKSIISETDLLELLPHGSGIDCNWSIIEHENGNVTAKNSFHAMNETGMYDGYMDFTVKIFKVKKSRVNKLKGPCEGQYQVVAQKGDIDFKVSCNESRKASFYGLKDYLVDTIDHALRSIITPMRSETLTEQEKDKWIKDH